MRNPLYLGTILHTLALCLLMSWVGAAFAVVAIALLQVLLIRSEERFLSATLGAAYRVYVQKVPRIVPRLTPVAAETAFQRSVAAGGPERDLHVGDRGVTGRARMAVQRSSGFAGVLVSLGCPFWCVDSGRGRGDSPLASARHGQCSSAISG